jgi:hypothetical protein
MKKMTLLLALVFSLSPSFAVTAMHGHASVFTVQTPNNFACYPLDENGEAAPIPYSCTGSATVIQITTNFTSFTAMLSRPVLGSHRIAIQAEDFTTGNNIGNACIITSGQEACSVSFSSSISAGDVVAVKIWDDLTAADSYNIEKINWVIQ